MNCAEAVNQADVIVGTFHLLSTPVYLLFDPEASRTSISCKKVRELRLEPISCSPIAISLPTGDIVACTKVYH